MNKKLTAGQKFPPLQTRNIHRKEISIPDGHWVHLQFRRFAGCPVCNLHLQSFVRRHKEISDAGIIEMVVFHSSDAELLPYQGHFPFDVIGDPLKKLYRKYGVLSSLSAILNPVVWAAFIKGILTKDKPRITLIPNGGLLGLPADFLIAPDGVIKTVHYGRHADDHWSVDDMLGFKKSAKFP
jgi:peroxiredoxin